MPNWGDMYLSTTPVLEVVLRGTLLYLATVVMMRIVGQRESGGLTVTDLLVVILIGNAVGHSMSTDYLSIPEGLILVATLLFWSVVLDAAAYRFPRLGGLLKARPRPLIEDGEVNQRSLRREFLSRDELEAQLRLQGVKDVSQVRRAYLEPNGMISAFKRDGDDMPTPPCAGARALHCRPSGARLGQG